MLHLPAASGQALEAGLQARSAALRGLDGPGVTVNASDQVWADPSLTTLRSYLNAVATGYDAGVAKVPLLHNPDQATQQIDQAIASRDPRADPATAGARLAAGHRLGADRRALPEGGLGHPVPGRRRPVPDRLPPAPDGRSARNS